MVLHAVLSRFCPEQPRWNIPGYLKQKKIAYDISEGPKPQLMPSHRGSQMPSTTVQESKSARESACCLCIGIVLRHKWRRARMRGEKVRGTTPSRFFFLHDQIWPCLFSFLLSTTDILWFCGGRPCGGWHHDVDCSVAGHDACSARCRGPALDEKAIEY